MKERVTMKGQVTFFLIAGLLLLLMLGLSFILISGMARHDVRETTADNYIEACLKLTADEGMGLLGRNAGMIVPDLPEESHSFGMTYYWLKRTRVDYPGIDEGMSQLDTYIESNIGQCISGMSQLGSMRIAKPKVKSTATAKSVIVNMQMPVASVTESGTQADEMFEVTLPVRYAKVHSLAEDIVSSRLAYQDSFDLGLLQESGLDVHILTYSAHHVIVITDTTSLLGSKPFMLIFDVDRRND